MVSKQGVLDEIPVFKRDGQTLVRKDFRDLHRIVSSQKLSQEEIEFFYREIVARKKALGFDRVPKASEEVTYGEWA